MIDSAQHKAQLQAYFDGAGFERWRAIYGEAELSRVRRTIRDGHGAMLALAQTWLREVALPAGAHVLDAGCGTGLLSVALAQQGFDITAVDIAPQMVTAAQERARQAGVEDRICFTADDLEAIQGSFDAVICLDVLVHYPRPLFAQLCAHLARCSRDRLVFTYAPHAPLLAALHWVGGKFPHGQRRTEIQMIPDLFVRRTLADAGMRVARTARISRGFYHVALVEAVHAD